MIEIRTLRQLRYILENSTQIKALNEAYHTGYICATIIDSDDRKIEYISLEPFSEATCDISDIELHGRAV